MVMILLTGCATNTVVTECEFSNIIYISKDDVLTNETARQIYLHNEKVEAVCQ